VPPAQAVWLCPLFFGTAHIHHANELRRQVILTLAPSPLPPLTTPPLPSPTTSPTDPIRTPPWTLLAAARGFPDMRLGAHDVHPALRRTPLCAARRRGSVPAGHPSLPPPPPRSIWTTASANPCICMRLHAHAAAGAWHSDHLVQHRLPVCLHLPLWILCLLCLPPLRPPPDHHPVRPLAPLTPCVARGGGHVLPSRRQAVCIALAAAALKATPACATCNRMHGFCNWMGFPDFESLVQHEYKLLLCPTLLLGIAGFYYKFVAWSM